MKVIVACGGTGGHSFPGLAVAEELVRRGHEVIVWSAGREIESSVLKTWSGPTFTTKARQLRLRYFFGILRSLFRCRRRMRRERPAVLLAMGSYSSLPPVLAARSCRVPVVLHEANTVPGKAVEFLSRYAQVVATSFAETARFLPSVKVELTGLPVRACVARGERFEFIPHNAFVVFVTGGSQGAHRVNELACEALVRLHAEIQRRASSQRALYVIHQTGAKDEAMVQARYAAANVPARVRAFEHEMSAAFASAALVVARAGASTCFELALCAKPALFIPLPSAVRNHQHFNAEAFVRTGAAAEADQTRLTAHQLFRYLVQKYDHPEELVQMGQKMATLARSQAAQAVAGLLERVGGEKK